MFHNLATRVSNCIMEENGHLVEENGHQEELARQTSKDSDNDVTLSEKVLNNIANHDLESVVDKLDKIYDDNVLNGALPQNEFHDQNGTLTLDEDNSGLFHTSFKMIAGEQLEQSCSNKDSIVFLTNFRFVVCYSRSFLNIPRRIIECVEMRELTAIHISCKDGKTFRVAFDNSVVCTEWWRWVASSEYPPNKLEELFAFTHHAGLEVSENQHRSSVGLGEAVTFVNDMKRMGFDKDNVWRVTEINTKFNVCKSYPKLHIVPAHMTDKEIELVAQFRSMRRFPSVVWRNTKNGAVIARCSQPEVGWLGWRCSQDEALLSAIAEAANMDDKEQPLPLLLIDARSYAAAVANRAKGGGVECQEYYPNCEIQFMGLANIHGIRKSFQGVRTLCQLGAEQTNWHSAMEATRWLQHLSLLVRSTLIIVDAIEAQNRSVLVHCSDGWDRTAQLVALSELLLDPYYRTIQGFKVLVEREWIIFGHKFGDRCGHTPDRDVNERSPVFFQWLDAVHQLMLQFPTAFEFNQFFISKLLTHAYSCLYGTFLCNNTREYYMHKLDSKTTCVWTMLLSGRKDFINYLYKPVLKTLYPKWAVKNMQFWEEMFMSQLTELDEYGAPDSANFRQKSQGEILTAQPFDPESSVEQKLEDCSLQDGISPLLTNSNVTITNGHIDNITRSEDNISLKCKLASQENTEGCTGTNFERINSCPNFQHNNMSQSSRSYYNDKSSNPNLHCTSIASDKSLISFPFDIGKYIDEDGLTKSELLVEKRMLDLELGHQQEIARLREQLEMERRERVAILRQMQEGHVFAPDVFHSLNNLGDDLSDYCNGGPSSVSSNNDEGWENIQYEDVQPTGWIPDHASPHCGYCGVQFSLLVRRHHCRKCGKVFCGTCSDHQLSVPEENLYKPVRVCASCFGHFRCPMVSTAAT